MLPALEGSFKKHNNGFLNDPKSQKGSFWPFSGVWSTGLKVKKSRTQKVWKSRSRQFGQAEKWRSREVKDFERREVQGLLTLSHLPRGKATVLNVSWGQGWYCPFLSVSVRNHFSWKTSPRIFPIFCMNVPYYKCKKRTRCFFRENSYSLIIHENVLKNGLF